MGVTTATFTQNLSVQDIVSSGYVLPQTLAQALAAPGIAGATLSYANGTGALQFDGLVFEPVALVASTPQTFDLTALTGLGGESINAARVRELIVFNPDATAGHDVQVYKGATNGWSILPPSTSPLPARAVNGMVRVSDPNSTGSGNGNVTGGSSKTVTLDPGAHNVTVYFILLTGSVA